MKINKQTTKTTTRYVSVEAFIEAKLNESAESVKKINFGILTNKKTVQKH